MSSKYSNFSFSELFQTDSFNPQQQITIKKAPTKTLNKTSTTLMNKTSSSLMNITNNSSNTSRYEEQKSFQKLKEQNLIQKLQSNLQRLQNFDKKMKNWMNFRPIKSTKKQNTNPMIQ